MNLKIALRNIARHKLTSFINILGLSIGITCALLVFMFVNFELSFDRFHEDSDRIERVIRETDTGLRATTAFVLAETIRNDFPELTVTKIFHDRSKVLYKHEGDLFYEDQMAWADEDFFKVFSFDIISGDPAPVFNQPFKLAINERTAQKYFGVSNPIGQFITMNWNEIDYPMEVVAVLKDFPQNSHLDFDILTSFSTGNQAFPGGLPDTWNMNYCYTYLRLPQGMDRNQVQAQLDQSISGHVSKKADGLSPFKTRLQPLGDIHFGSQVQGDLHAGGDFSYLIMAGVLGGLILIIAGINFMNLSIASFGRRTKEIAIKKISGANKASIARQFLMESVLISVLALLLAYGILVLSIPFINSLFDIHLNTKELFALKTLGPSLFGTMALGLLAGLYPALLLSSFKGLDLIKGAKNTRAGKFELRKILVVVQFLMTTVLITGAIVLYEQLDYVSNKALGFDKEQILVIPHGRKVRDNPQPLKSEFLRHSSVNNVSLSVYTPSQNINFQIPVWTSKSKQEDPFNIAAISVDTDFYDTYGIEFLEGRNFDRSIATDSSQAFIINESAQRLLGLDQPLGEVITTTYNTGNLFQPTETRSGQIIGVLKDFHFEPLQTEIRPTLYLIKPYWFYYISVKLNTNDLTETLAHLESSWAKIVPDRPFEYFFLDDTFQSTYATEKAWSKRILSISVLAIGLACFGLFGMISFAVQRRLKEIGIRKVLGAASGSIMWLLSKEVLILLAIANLFAWPLAWLGSEKLLQKFAYHIEISPFLLLLPVLITLVVAFVTMSGQLFKAIIINPAEVLRNE